MTGGAVRRYTDRDVRENPDFETMVEDYLRNYHGEFEFLIDNKMRVAQGIHLTVGMIRGVLNCMRHDPRVVDLPQPLPVDDNVVVFPNHRGSHKVRYGKSYGGQLDCYNEEAHYGPHDWQDDEHWFKCPGIPWLINREAFTLPATVRRPFVCARTGAYIHKVKIDGDHFFRWYPQLHEWGWLLDPVLSVQTDCKYPYRIDKPLLFSCDPGDVAQVGRQNCPHCGGTE